MIEQYWVVLVLIAALSHAIWNFLLKTSEDKSVFLWTLRLSAVLFFLPFSIKYWPSEQIPLKYWILFGVGSSFLHGIYGIILTKAYEKSDFTLAYPVARGTGPLLVVLIGLTILGEPVKWDNVIGALLIFLGIYVLYSGWGLKNGIQALKTVIMSPYPLLVGISIAAYTIFDKLAIVYIPPIILNVIENSGQVLILTSSIISKPKSDIIHQWKTHWYKMFIGGILSGLAYIIVLIVLTKVPVSSVAPVRESSIVIGTILGFLILNETFNLQKILGSAIIFIGVVFIAL